MDLTYYFNTDKYTVAQLAMCAIGGTMWAVLYIIMIFTVRKDKYVEMPFFVAAGNIAWEGLWAYVFSDYIDLGAVFVYLYRAWFIFDCFVFYHVFIYGHIQTTNPYVRKYYKPLLLSIVACWAGLIYSFVKSGYDFPLGVNSAYILNLIISVLIIFQYMRQYQSGTFLKTTAWLKMLGTGIITIAFWNMIPPDSYFEHVAGPIVFVLDCYYIWMMYYWKNPQIDPAFDPKVEVLK
jgi:hypothetical protein